MLRKIQKDGVTPEFYEWVSREQFEEWKNKDCWKGGLVKSCWSFGNSQNTYLYGRDIEEKKRLANKFIV